MPIGGGRSAPKQGIQVMRLNELGVQPGGRKARKRVGRGIGSGKGKTCGHGIKGQKARAGVAINAFEGGQMPIYRRLPKRGFTNPFTRNMGEVTVASLDRAVSRGLIDANKPVTEDALRAGGLVKKSCDGVRLLARGELKAKLTVEVSKASEAAVALIEKAGGSVTVIPQKAKPEGKGKARHRRRKEKAEKAELAAKKAAEKAAKGEDKALAEAKPEAKEKKKKKDDAADAGGGES
jgi:large subunit ribosomal protein L15